jgi:hypothetical protein
MFLLKAHWPTSKTARLIWRFFPIKALGKNKLNKLARIFELDLFDPKATGHRNSHSILRTFWLRIEQIYPEGEEVMAGV